MRTNAAEEIIPEEEEQPVELTLEETIEEAPQLPSKAEFDELKGQVSQVLEVLSKRQEPASATIQEPVKQVDTRDPWEIAQAEAQANGNEYNEEWKFRRVSQIQSQRHQESLEDLKKELIGAFGQVVTPLVQDRALQTLAGGDQEVATELQGLINDGTVTAYDLQNPKIASLVSAAARQFAQEKRPVQRQIAAAAPTGGAGTSVGSGLIAKLTPAERQELRDTEARNNIKFDDNDIREIFPGRFR